MAGTILIAEDEVVLRESLAELLASEGYRVLEAGNGKEAWELASSEQVDVVLSDVRMPEMDGMALLDALHEMAPELPVVMLTAYGTVNDAVSAMRAGAIDYLLKPVQFEEVLMRVRRALEHKDMARTARVMTEQLSADSVFHNLVGRAPRMLELFDMVRKLSNVKSNVLLWGESGTGKELFARAIHYNSDARDKPFVPVNCGAIPENLAESELFGHSRGAFTGAAGDRTGYFEAADGGTLFLDEISTLPLTVQSSLLRALDTKTIVRVGDTRPRTVDLRVIAASNQDLTDMVDEGSFRGDLLYRLNVVRLDIPPLRDRKEDIPMLVQHFLAKHCRSMNKHVTGVSDGAMAAILNCEWRGNVRELENVIERAVIFADGGELRVTHLPFATDDMVDDVDGDMKSALRQFERQHIMFSLRKCGYDKAETAKRLGIGISSLYRKLDEMGILKSEHEPKSDAVAEPDPSDAPGQ